jgi:hypothetical protein
LAKKTNAFNRYEENLADFFVMAEKNALLKRDKKYASVKRRIIETETQINPERLQFNEHIRYYNGNTKKFPNRYVADFTNNRRLGYINLYGLSAASSSK